MSKCISLNGEYSEHVVGESGDERFVCQRCFAFDEDAALVKLAEVERERDELQAAHELMARQFRTMQAEKECGWREADRQESRADAAEARLAAVRALHPRGSQATSEHHLCVPSNCDRAGEGEMEPWCWTCSEPWPCATIRALAVPAGTAQPEAHGMIPGSHERAGGPECRCGAAWNQWADRCAAQPDEEQR